MDTETRSEFHIEVKFTRFTRYKERSDAIRGTLRAVANSIEESGYLTVGMRMFVSTSTS